MTRRRSRGLLPAVLALVAGLGCDEDIFLGGKWIPSGLDPERAREFGRWLGRCPVGTADSSCELYLEVSMGHYGEDVVGVLRFFENESRQREAECRPAEGLYCTCSSLEGVYRDSELSFELRDCSDALHSATMERLDSETVRLVLEPLEGCAEAGQASSERCQPFELELAKVLSEDQLTVKDKACTECRKP